MKILTDQEVSAWCSHHGIEKQGRKLVFGRPYENWVVIDMPKMATERMMLCIDLLLLGGVDESITDLIWISTWRIWSDWNDDFGEFMVAKLRAQADEAPSPLGEASGHLLSLDERTLSTALLWQMMLFNWDCFLVPATGEHIVECSHDEIVWIMCRTGAAHERALINLSRWKPKIRSFIPS